MISTTPNNLSRTDKVEGDFLGEERGKTDKGGD